MMKSKVLTAVVGVSLFALMGCTPEARQDVKEAGSNIGQATEKSAEGTAEAVNKAGAEVKEEAQQAGAAVQEGTQRVGEAVGGAVENAAEATKGAAREVSQETKEAGASLVLTPKIKNALIASKQIDASTINVETDGEKKMVVLKGTIPTAEKKQLATQIAQKALTDSKSPYKVQNDLTVGAATANNMDKSENKSR